MTTDINLDPTLWERILREARKRKRSPRAMLDAIVRRQLDEWDADELFESIRTDALKSGYSEEDAVRLVRDVRSRQTGTGAGA